MNSEILCPVCGCGFEERHKIIACEECLTPHHHDCWDYNGSSCAIYGCSSTVNAGHLLMVEKPRRKAIRKPAVLTKSVSSIAYSPFKEFNDFLVVIYKKISMVQRLAFRYIIYSMAVFPIILMAVSSFFNGSKGCGGIAVIPMYPTILISYLFLILVIPVTIFRVYFKFANFNISV